MPKAETEATYSVSPSATPTNPASMICPISHAPNRPMSS